MEKLKMHSPDLTQENIARIQELFPNCVTEMRDKNGNLKLVVDFDQLRQELSDSIVEGPQERYHLNWPGKREALLTANAPIAKTLRPCREESVNFDTTKNIFIEGDNLEALKLLQESYLGKVKMIYIDPPYNTGNDFIYEDDFAQNSEEYFRRSNQKDDEGNRLVPNPESNGRFHSDWLTMMYPRLKLARNLLKDEGVIVIHIDENEYSNLEKLLAEIFGEKNNLGTIVWDKRNPKGDSKGVAQQHELISIYCKNFENFKKANDFKRSKENANKMIEKVKQLIKSENGVNDNVRSIYKEWLKKQNFSGGEKAYSQIDETGAIFQSVSMAWPNRNKAPEDYFVPLTHPVTKRNCVVPERGWRNPSLKMKELLRSDLIVFGIDESIQPRRKYFLEENLEENVPSLLYYSGNGGSHLSELELYFDNPKPVAVSKKLIQPICSKDDIILDFFAGSSTTAQALMELNAEDGGNRQFIMVQLHEICDVNFDLFNAGFKNIAEISKERIRRVAKVILDGVYHENWGKDAGFRVFKIDSSNMKDVYYRPDDTTQMQLDFLTDNIKQDRSNEDLLFQVLQDWGVYENLSLPIRKETIQGKTVFFVDENALVACFDKNLNEELVKKLTEYKPLRVVFRDTGFASDAVKINVEQIFKQMSPETEVRTI